MAPIFGFRRNADEDDRTAGGKITKSRRRTAAERTPYARSKPASPPLTEEPVPERSGNPNWLSGLIYPARVVASGAGKVISAVFCPDPLSPLSSSGGDSSSDDEDAACADDDELNKELSSADKSENMHLIQQLVMQETFSREECDELIKLVESRVVNWDGTFSNTEETNLDARINAVMEAKKWLEEKKFGPGSKSKITENEVGSPVDMAKSFMQDRPSWSSASLKKNVEFGTPSPTQISKSIFCNPVHQSEPMKTSDLSAGSWNIMDEIRKVRSKATDELLATTPSKQIDLTSFSVEDKSTRNTMTNNMGDMKTGHDMHNLSSLMSNIEPNASVDLTATNSHGLPETVGMECETLQTQGSQTNTASLVLKQSQDNETIRATGDLGAIKVTDPSVRQGLPHSHEMNGLRTSAIDGETLSLSAADQALEPRDKEMEDVVDLTQDNMDGDSPGENRNEHSDCALDANDNDHIVNGSQDSSSLLYEDSLQHEGKKAPPGRRLRPRKGRARGK